MNDLARNGKHLELEIAPEFLQEHHTEDYYNRETIGTPVEEVDIIGIEVCFTEPLEELCSGKENIIPIPVDLLISGTDVEVNKLSEVVLYTNKLNSSWSVRDDIQINCILNCLHNGHCIIGNIEEIEVGKYSIKFTPTSRGRHEVTVLVDGQQVVSHFTTFVSAPPTELDKPVKVWNGITLPGDIAVNSLGEIIVKGIQGDVVVLNREGERLSSINHARYQLLCSRGVTVDSEDNMYFTDQNTNQIYKSNKDCSKVQGYKIKQENGPGYIDVAVAQDEIMVTECGNEGSIMVYDKELKYVRKIIGESTKKFTRLFYDSHGRSLYVITLERSEIQVLTMDGKFLFSFGADGSGIKKLQTPRALCVAGKYIYVADVGMAKIVVFTKEGIYVTSFGSGSYYGAVCVDEDGFVYACNFMHNKIDIY